MVTLDAPPGSIAERITRRLDHAQSEGHGKSMDYMRLWLQTGYLVSEIGHGVLESWLAMERDGHTRDMTQQQKAQMLIELLQRITWSSNPNPNPKTQPPAPSLNPPESVSGSRKKTKLSRHTV